MEGFLPWLGGKRALAKTIVPRVESIPHVCYCEPFMGGAHVFFRRRPARSEVLNDLNRDLVTLYRVVQHHLDEFVRYFRWSLVSRDEWDRLERVAPDTLTDIQRAARFFYLQKLAFGGKPTGRNLAMHRTGHPRLNLLRLEEELSAVHLRLARVQIENVPWGECIRRYDGTDTLFYVDPPYWGCENYYRALFFKREDFVELSRTLQGIAGGFILSLNDVPEIRELFAWARIETVTTYYGVGTSNNGDKVTELLISNRETSGLEARQGSLDGLAEHPFDDE
jgi:DNA adenine methylase